jgi:uncharacterized protein (TIGR02996 family)
VTEARLLAAVLASPEDIAPRLVYGDWLLERGDLRGEFVLLQCQPDDSDLVKRERERSLLLAHERQWLQALGLRLGEGSFERGLVERLTLTVERAREVLAELGTRAPVRGLTLSSTVEDAGDVLLALSCLPGLADLDVRVERLAFPEVQRLAASPALARLSRLALHGLDDEGVCELMSSPHLTGLRALHLSGRDFGVRGVHALLQSPSLTALASLELHYNRPDIVPVLAGSARLAQLASLGLGGVHMSSALAQLLARSPHLGGLTSLDLSSNTVGDEGALALARAAHLGRLAQLDLTHNQLGDEGALALADSAGLGRLASLELGWNTLSPRGILALLRSARLPLLTELGLAHNGLGDEEMAALAPSGALARLHRLDMRHNRLQDPGLRALISAPSARSLRELDLRANLLGDEGAYALIESPYLDDLRILRISDDDLRRRLGWSLEGRLGLEATQRLQDRFGARVRL